MESPGRICRFCFEKCDTNFKAIEGSNHEILNMLLVTMNFAVSDEPVMCTNCSEILQNCFIFKTTFLDVRNQTVAFCNNTNNDHVICEFCMTLLENCPFTILDIDEDIPEKAMLEKHFQELDLSTSKKVVICEVCRGSLAIFLTFATMSSIAEEKIKEYCQVRDVDNTDPINLSNVVQYTAENLWKENDNELDVYKMEDMISVRNGNEKMKIQRGICTLCSDKCDGLKAIDDSMKDVLDILLPKIDFTIILGLVICKNCEEVFIKCFDFKATCLHTHNYIVTFPNNEDHVELDLKDMYLSRNVTSAAVPEDQDVCGFCMGLVKNCLVVSLDVGKGNVMLKKMIEQCLPELDLSIIKNPVICGSCHESLKNYFHFVINWMIVAEKIKKLSETPDMNSTGQVDPSNSLKFTIRDDAKREANCDLADIIKVEEPLCIDRDNLSEREIDDGRGTVKLEQIFLDDSKYAIKDVKEENKCFMEMNDQKISNEQQSPSKNMFAHAGQGNKLGSIKIEEEFYEQEETKHKEENFVEMEDNKFLFDQEIEIKTDEHDFNSFEDGIASTQSEVTRRLHRKGKSSVLNLEKDQLNSYIKNTLTKKHVSKIRMYQTELRSFKAKHKNFLVNHNLILEGFRKRLLVYTDPSGVTLYKCDICPFETKHKYCLKRHLVTHKNPSEVTLYKCDYCPFETKHKVSLKDHLLKHKEPSEVTMYKCDHCLYQTKYKKDLKKHLILHKSPSEVTMHKCDYCSVQTKHKNGLKKHMILHKNPSEVTMYKCDSCSFQTKHKEDVKKHMIVHKNPSEVTMYKCHSCTFETKHKDNLRTHLLIHKNPSEVPMFKCDSCSFQSRRKRSLKDHLLKHKDPSEVTVYKCDSCSFQTVIKNNLKGHLLVHKHPSEIKMYKCASCSVQKKHKNDLRKHMLIHKKSSEVTMYKCEYCSFQTKRKDTIKTHLLIHKDPSEITMYKCDFCSFQAKRKMNLKTHLLTHKDPSEVTMYKCDTCSYQTKYKDCLKTHALKHKDPSEVTMYKCDICIYQTIRKNDLMKHLILHKDPSNQVTLYKCNHCSFQTKVKYRFEHHELTHNNS